MASALRARSLAPSAGLRLRDADRLRRYRLYQHFYEGRHFARPRSGRTSLVLNYARTIVDKGVAYLLGRGLNFAVRPEREADDRERRRAQTAERILYDVYWDSDLGAVDLQVAQNAGVLGDGVYKVFWDELEGRIRVLNVDPFTFFAEWAPDDPSRLVRAETAYVIAGQEVIERWTDRSFEVVRAGTMDYRGDPDPRGGGAPSSFPVERSGPNPYGWIPFVHVPNLQPANRFWGQSDLVDVIPIIRELNERVSDQADTVRFHADPPVVFKGVTDHSDLTGWPTR